MWVKKRKLCLLDKQKYQITRWHASKNRHIHALFAFGCCGPRICGTPTNANTAIELLHDPFDHLSVNLMPTSGHLMQTSLSQLLTPSQSCADHLIKALNDIVCPSPDQWTRPLCVHDCFILILLLFYYLTVLIVLPLFDLLLKYVKNLSP